MKRDTVSLSVGDKIKIGPECSSECGLAAGSVITLIEGEFEYYNGLYDTIQIAPAIWNDTKREFDSIYHLFGNDLDGFLDSEIIEKYEQQEDHQ